LTKHAAQRSFVEAVVGDEPVVVVDRFGAGTDAR
jgi:hypothetical protein